MSKANNIFCGTKYYRYINSKLEVIRIKFYNSKKENVKYVKDGDTDILTMSCEYLNNNYKRLKPDAVGIISIVKNNDTKDVIVAISKDNKPFIVCRQCIQDVFSTLSDPNSGIIYVGMSISEDTCPPGVNFKSIVSCTKLLFSLPIAIYIGDNIDSILDILPSSKKFDNAINECSNKLLEMYGNRCTLYGLTKSLKELLETHNFMYDVRRLFNIVDIPFAIAEDDVELTISNRDALSRELGVDIYKTYIIKYDKTIDMSKIVRDYVLVSSIENEFKDVYICGYDKV